MLVALGVLLAALLATGPPGRPLHPARGADGGRTRAARPLRRRPGAADDLPGLLLAVAARLRSGAPAGAAWSDVLGVDVPGALPRPADLLGRVAPGRRRPDPRLVGRVQAVVAGARVAVELGAPLADVLEDLATAATTDAEHTADVEAALAGPRATARVLLWLPLAGVGLGALLGAQPWRVLLDGGIGTAALVLGLGLVLAGRAWVAALLARARDAGTPRPARDAGGPRGTARGTGPGAARGPARTA
ncbi:type II secretion system F family protein [Cellulomonas oligotrophica]|uniref:Tight adherence protein B n=1 Tax=Cellulomonas oligotrophica TaxID=931536 RepID=A0A7Y9JX77_9CELL|nr:type II secretion protein F [Cellulomonas oligotrophica]NYD85641.1 tight adherence protein B [Cellulomonas oligotrophica]GIG31351.1 hypothetical protein Col01nite_05100 [Cellulomonas oligotrophica]